MNWIDTGRPALLYVFFLCVGKWACMHIISASPSLRVVGVGLRCLKYTQALTTPLGAALPRLALASTEPDKWNLIPPSNDRALCIAYCNCMHAFVSIFWWQCVCRSVYITQKYTELPLMARDYRNSPTPHNPTTTRRGKIWQIWPSDSTYTVGQKNRHFHLSPPLRFLRLYRKLIKRK